MLKMLLSSNYEPSYPFKKATTYSIRNFLFFSSFPTVQKQLFSIPSFHLSLYAVRSNFKLFASRSQQCIYVPVDKSTEDGGRRQVAKLTFYKGFKAISTLLGESITVFSRIIRPRAIVEVVFRQLAFRSPPASVVDLATDT